MTLDDDVNIKNVNYPQSLGGIVGGLLELKHEIRNDY